MNTYDKIDLELKEIGSTRKEMCRNIGVSYNTIASLYQRKSENISLEVLRAISRYLNVSLDYLIFEDAEVQDSVGMKKSPPSEDRDDIKEQLIENYDSMNDAGQLELLKHSRLLLNDNQYKKCDEFVMCKGTT